MSHSRTMTIEHAVEEAKDGRSNVILCPAHEDQQPSLSVSPGRTQPVVFKCQAGCESDAIIDAAGLDWADVSAPLDPMARSFSSSTAWTPVGEASKVYRYTDAAGHLLFEVLRVDHPKGGGGKRIFQRRPDSRQPHGHAWNLDGVVRVLYNLPKVVDAVTNGETIHITEGEKCADLLQSILPAGEIATTNPGGAGTGKWLSSFSEVLTDANVVLYADSDDAGRAHMREVRESLLAVGCTVKVMEAPSGVIASTGKSINDVGDHIEAGLGLDQLLEVTPEAAVEKAKTGLDLLDLLLRPRGMTEYVIDGTLAKGERLILIGFEGQGKSTLCRQVAVMAAAGIHPFTHMPMREPKRVLFVDAENHPDQVLDSWGQLAGLAARHGYPVERGMLTVMEEYATGRDLTDPEGAAWLVERVHAYRPDLVIMGPLTNLADRDLRDDEPVRKIRKAVDLARTVCDSAFIMEHHAPHKGPMDRERAVRPYGSSLFLKWPDYGFGIKPTDDPKAFEWHKTRGSRVRSREWPEGLREGRENSLEWPWMPCFFNSDGTVMG